MKTHISANIPQCMGKVPNKEQPLLYKHTAELHGVCLGEGGGCYLFKNEIFNCIVV